MPKVEYNATNSGGDWWLNDDDWFALEKAGWVVDWVKDFKHFTGSEDGRWLGTLAMSATRHGRDLKEAVTEWEAVTQKCSTDAGCACCGQPHSFTMYDDDGKYVSSGPDISYRCEW